MGRYLNSSTSYVLYKGQTEQPYFVDKSQMLSELFPFLDSGNTHICITRPRRFGKTVMANMITAFLGKKQDSDSIFKSLKISRRLLFIPIFLWMVQKDTLFTIHKAVFWSAN